MPLAEARVPVTDRGFLWGDHVFEIIRAQGDTLCDGAAHLARLVASAALVRLPAPDPAFVERVARETLTAAGLAAASIRVMWTRGDARGLAPSAAGAPRLVILVEPLAPAPHGVRLAVVRGSRDGLVPAAAKTGNYLGSVLALALAENAGADDALLVDGDECALETATASLFVVEPGKVLMPAGANLPGVTAARVAALLVGAGHAVISERLPLARVVAADELFVTSARRGLVPVVALDGAPRLPGPVTATASAAHAAWVRACTISG